MWHRNILSSTLILALLINSLALQTRVITTLKYSLNHVKPVIVNGKQAYRGEVNFMVSLKVRSQPGKTGRTAWETLCGGSIIKKDQVLTAAHCFEDKSFFYQKHPEYVRIVAGNFNNVVPHDGSTETTPTSQWRKISDIVIHSKFNYPMHDIALVNAKMNFVFNEEVSSIRCARKTTDYPLSCKSAGFGLLSHSGQRAHPSPVLMVASIEPMMMAQCSELWGMDMSTFICSHSAVTDVAIGDSGGPMSCKGTEDTQSLEEPILVGVVSGKNFDRTTLFTRVSSYRDWIDKSIGCRLKSICLLVAIIQLVFILCLVCIDLDRVCIQ